MLESLGLKTNGLYQELEGIGVFYPQTYFSPYDYINCRTFKTNKHMRCITFIKVGCLQVLELKQK